MTKKCFIVTAILMVSFLTGDLLAQRPGRHTGRQTAERPAERMGQRQPGAYCMEVLDLTEAQSEAIQQLRLAQLENGMKHRNEMASLRLKKRALMLEKDPAMGNVNEVIDQMSELRSAQMKQAVAHRQAIRDLLTDEQRILFDSRYRKSPAMGGQGRAHGGRGPADVMRRGRR